MKYLKKYKLFLEEDEFDVNITDDTDLKMSKENLENTRKQLTEFKTKKPLIDNAYLKINIDSDLQSKIEEIVGKESENRNPFLVEYLHVADLNRKINKLQKELVDDKISKDDFTQQIGLSPEQSTKDALNQKITDITNRISTKNANISSLMKEVNDSSNELKLKMSKIEKDMQGYIKKISSEDVK